MSPLQGFRSEGVACVRLCGLGVLGLFLLMAEQSATGCECTLMSIKPGVSSPEERALCSTIPCTGCSSKRVTRTNTNISLLVNLGADIISWSFAFQCGTLSLYTLALAIAANSLPKFYFVPSFVESGCLLGGV